MTQPRAVAVVLSEGRVLVMKRYLKHPRTCAMCPRGTLACAGHDYAVLPGGGVERGESFEEAVVRELHEETTLTARIERQLWSGRHVRRRAVYFLMTDVEGTPTLSGEEAAENNPLNSYELRWATPDQFDELNLFPRSIHERLTELM
ncbi:NUDIX hydrolase [Paractinoplanes brasiliensis]|uniref:ADP-ribose pyrophosphatase YjhB (NUDIX family) n=1 Tax=Paractinoplanes brasiliensis TaxID=52695 RepID=A0A4R6JX02_9ACTN|nr:NUDIX domain-containing protein [Actinoplanes brasiliensis]TDO41310.1 ADP-ribose pyrophosphatase YjhB (NUDIX family) [Actinoplanes brasiliensis]GID27408.1 DNA mismatch repair protein MutT [Actinoplanes brasiliensis]